MRRTKSLSVLLVLGAVLLVHGCSNSNGSGSSSTGGGARSVAPAASVRTSSVVAPGLAVTPAPARPASPGGLPSPAPTPSPAVSTPLVPAPPPFVKVDTANAQFVIAGKPFYFCGTNAYYLMQEKAQGSTVSLDALDAAKVSGFRVVRTWGFFDSSPGTGSVDPAILQLSPGVYQESAFKAMDWVIAEAAKRDIRLIITLVNNWDAYGGMNQYVQWFGLSGHDQFFTDPGAKQAFKNYMRDFVSRKNSITGIAYKDDPTIMSWELANEAECRSDPGALQGTLLKWYAEMSAYLKSVDPNHLVATGEEGFDVTTTNYTGFTSYTTYFAVFSWIDGTSFTQNIALPDIDWGSLHLYPDTWSWLDPTSDGVNWIADHVKIARARGKPLLLAEYGLERSSHSIYKTWLDTVIATGAAGALLWEFVPASRSAQTAEAFNVVYPTEAADVAVQQAAAAALNAK